MPAGLTPAAGHIMTGGGCRPACPWQAGRAAADIPPSRRIPDVLSINHDFIWILLARARL